MTCANIRPSICMWVRGAAGIYAVRGSGTAVRAGLGYANRDMGRRRRRPPSPSRRAPRSTASGERVRSSDSTERRITRKKSNQTKEMKIKNPNGLGRVLVNSHKRREEIDTTTNSRSGHPQSRSSFSAGPSGEARTANRERSGEHCQGESSRRRTERRITIKNSFKWNQKMQTLLSRCH